MSHRAAVVAAAAALTLATFVRAAEPQSPKSDTSSSVADLIAQLSSSDPTAQRAGLAALDEWPPDDFPALEAAARRDDLPTTAAKALNAFVTSERPRIPGRLRIQRLIDGSGAANLASALAAYEKVGRRDPKWDAPAREAIAAFVGVTRAPAAYMDRIARRDRALKQCHAAGCDDPLINYFYARAASERRTDHARVAESLAKAADALEASAYPAYRKFNGHLHYVVYVLNSGAWQSIPDWRAKLTPHLDRAVALWPDVVGDPAQTDRQLYDLVDNFETAWLYVAGDDEKQGDRGAFVEKVAAPWIAARPKENGGLCFKGRQYTRYAWDARGSGTADTVSPDAAKLMQDRLAVAEQALTAAADIDPADPRPPTLMLTVELGQGKGRAVMEKWFARAMANNAGNYDACHAKMYYLEPKWYGSAEDMLAFGRECQRAGYYIAGLPFLLINAHDTIATSYSPDPATYYQDPAVWRDIRAVYEPYLARYGVNADHDINPHYHRARFAYYATRAAQWAEAHRQFNLLGDNPPETVIFSVFRSREAYDSLRRLAATRAGDAPAETDTPAAPKSTSPTPAVPTLPSVPDFPTIPSK